MATEFAHQANELVMALGRLALAQEEMADAAELEDLSARAATVARDVASAWGLESGC